MQYQSPEGKLKFTHLIFSKSSFLTILLCSRSSTTPAWWPVILATRVLLLSLCCVILFLNIKYVLSHDFKK